MAKLILTEQEKADKSYLNWSDADIGRYVKHYMFELEKIGAKIDKEKERPVMTALVMLLICQSIEFNSQTTVHHIKDLTEGDKQLGSWEVIIRQARPWYARVYEWFDELLTGVHTVRGGIRRLTQTTNFQNKTDKIELEISTKDED